MSGLCRVVFAGGESKAVENDPSNQITRVAVDIIRKAALWNRRSRGRIFRLYREWPCDCPAFRSGSSC
jgi:hypothetical protein